jgi:hypothetical protein
MPSTVYDVSKEYIKVIAYYIDNIKKQDVFEAEVNHSFMVYASILKDLN